MVESYGGCTNGAEASVVLEMRRRGNCLIRDRHDVEALRPRFLRSLEPLVDHLAATAGDALKDLPAETPLRADVWAGDGGTVVEQQLYRNEVTGGWRLSLKIRNSLAPIKKTKRGKF